MNYLFVVILFLFMSCSKQGPTVRIGMNEWAGYELIFAAKVKGLYKKHGLNVEILEFSSLNDVKTAYERGQVDIMCSTLIELLKSYEDTGIRSKVLMPTDFSNGPDVIIGNKLSKLSDLKGKRIGVEKGTLGMYMLARALQISNLEMKDISIVPLDQTTMIEGIQNNTIDVAITYPPISINLLKRVEDAKVLFSSKEIPYEVIDVLVIKEDFLKKSPDVPKKIKKVWDEALGMLKTHKNEMVSIMAKREKITNEELIEIMDGLVFLPSSEQKKLYGSDKKMEKTIDTTIEVLLETKDLSKKIKAEIFL